MNLPPSPGPRFGTVELCPVLPVLLLPALLPPPLSPLLLLLLPLPGELCVLDWVAQGFGKGSLFSVRDGWLSPPEDELLTKEANGLPPNYKINFKKSCINKHSKSETFLFQGNSFGAVTIRHTFQHRGFTAQLFVQTKMNANIITCLNGALSIVRISIPRTFHAWSTSPEAAKVDRKEAFPPLLSSSHPLWDQNTHSQLFSKILVQGFPAGFARWPTHSGFAPL